jgi:uncharacterized protein (TIGR02453 family)
MPTDGTLRFLADLATNNDRGWFAANKDRYITEVQEPALEFIIGFAPRLRRISPRFSADARVVGGSLFRIQRDTRFSNDKTPYKLNTGFHFRHESAGDVHAPAFYLHIQPGHSFAGVGVWRPNAQAAAAIRRAIVDDPTGWKRAAHSARFTERWTLESESMVRPPRGFDPDHRWVADLKRKDYVATSRLDDGAVVSAGFLDEFDGLCRRAAPFARFLCSALDLPF